MLAVEPFLEVLYIRYALHEHNQITVMLDARLRNVVAEPVIDLFYLSADSSETNLDLGISLSGENRQLCRDLDRKSTRLNSSHRSLSRMPSSA